MQLYGVAFEQLQASQDSGGGWLDWFFAVQYRYSHNDWDRIIIGMTKASKSETKRG